MTATFFFGGERDGNDRQAGRLRGDDHPFFGHARRTAWAVRCEHDVAATACGSNQAAQSGHAPPSRRPARRGYAVMRVDPDGDVTVSRLRAHDRDRPAELRVQHQQKMVVPEGDDVLRHADDVFDVDVPDAQRGMQSANDERTDERQEPLLQASTSSVANCMS